MPGNQPNTDVLSFGVAARRLRDAVMKPASQAAFIRTLLDGVQLVQGLSGKALGADIEGSRYVCRTPTPDTGINGIAAASSFTDTSPFVLITNNEPAGGKDVVLDFIKLITQTPGTNGTNLKYATKLDSIKKTSTAGSGGNGTGMTTPLNGPYPTNSEGQADASTFVYAGALVATASGPDARLLDNGPIRSTIEVANDVTMFNFGANENIVDDLAIATATAYRMTIPHVGVAIAPGGSFALYLYAASQTVASAREVIVSYFKR